MPVILTAIGDGLDVGNEPEICREGEGGRARKVSWLSGMQPVLEGKLSQPGKELPFQSQFPSEGIGSGRGEPLCCFLHNITKYC